MDDLADDEASRASDDGPSPSQSPTPNQLLECEPEKFEGSLDQTVSHQRPSTCDHTWPGPVRPSLKKHATFERHFTSITRNSVDSTPSTRWSTPVSETLVDVPLNPLVKSPQLQKKQSRGMSLKDALGGAAPEHDNGSFKAIEPVQNYASRTSRKTLLQEFPTLREAAPQSTLTQLGVDDIHQLLAWSHSKPKEHGFLSRFEKLCTEVERASATWCAAKWVSRWESVVPDQANAPPPNPFCTAQATSFMLQMIQCLPSDSALRHLLDPLVQEMMHAIFHNWKSVRSLSELQPSEVSLEKIRRLLPFYALVLGHQQTAEREQRHSSELQVVNEALRKSEAAAQKQLDEERQKSIELQERLNAEERAHKATRNMAMEAQEAHATFHHETRAVMHKFVENRDELQSVTEELKVKSKDLDLADRRIEELCHLLDDCRHSRSELEIEVSRMQTTLSAQEHIVAAMPALQQKVEQFEKIGMSAGIGLASRIANEIIGVPLEELCKDSRSVASAKAKATRDKENRGHSSILVNGERFPNAVANAMVDCLCVYLKSVMDEIEKLKHTTDLARLETEHYKHLVPIWNAEYRQDIEDAYNEKAPIHHQLYCVKDQRNFAGLGLGEDVPMYLRHSGIIRHVFVSKAEMENFMDGFWDHFMSKIEATGEIHTDLVHSELYLFMKTKDEDHEQLLQFSYAFMCGLETYRSDPDFELFDLVLSGMVHPSVISDQRDLLNSLEILLRNCQEGAGLLTDEAANRNNRPSPKGSSTREQVSRRITRGVLQATFPQKSEMHHNALRRALYGTVQMLNDAGKITNPDCVYISDLFAGTADGSQTAFIEEIRRQHYYEIVEFSCEIAQKLLDAETTDVDWANAKTNAQTFKDVLRQMNPSATKDWVDDLVEIACPEEDVDVPVGQALLRLRCNRLLKPPDHWVHAEPQDVVNCLRCVLKHELSEEFLPFNRRNRALKVVNNPLQNMCTSEILQPSLDKVTEQFDSDGEDTR